MLSLVSPNKIKLFISLSPHKMMPFNTLRPRQNGRHFVDDIFKCIFLNENVWIPIKISLKFVPKGPINNIPALVQIMAWRRPGDKTFSEPMLVSLPTHICVTRHQWVNSWTAPLSAVWMLMAWYFRTKASVVTVLTKCSLYHTNISFTVNNTSI